MLNRWPVRAMAARWRTGTDTGRVSSIADPVATAAPLPTRIAIDIAVSELSRDGRQLSRTLVIASSLVAAEEALIRLDGPVTVWCTGPAIDPAGVKDLVAQLCLDGVEVRSPGDARVGPAPARHWRALWLSPVEPTWQQDAARIAAALHDGAHVAIVGRGPLARIPSRPGSSGGGPVESVADPFNAGRAIGAQTLVTWRIGGIRSAAWAVLRIAAGRIGRTDLADRSQAAYQLALTETGSPRLWLVGLWVGRT